MWRKRFNMANKKAKSNGNKTFSMKGCVNRTFKGTDIVITDVKTGKVIDTVFTAKAKDKLDPMREMFKYCSEKGVQGVSVELVSVEKSIAVTYEDFKNIGKPYNPKTGNWIGEDGKDIVEK